MGMQQGLSGLSAADSDLDVIGNNIANASTYGAKASTAVFSDMYANAISGAGGTTQIGIGTTMSSVAQQFTQGTITTTGNPLDVAINGNGFFSLSSNASGTGTLSYTRNGQFNVNASGLLVNTASGQYVLGNATGSSGTQALPIQVPTNGSQPAATQNAAVDANLDATSATTYSSSAAVPINIADSTTYNDATSQTVYDSQGNAINLTYYFQNAGGNTWNVYVAQGGSLLSSGAGSASQPITLNFNSNGTPAASTTNPLVNQIAVTTTNGAGTENINLDLSGLTQYGSAYAVTNQTQDGYTAGQLSGVTIDSSGNLTASYSNGQTSVVAQLAMANFQNPQGLQAQSGNVWTATAASGAAIPGSAGVGNVGVLQSGALESSNVDLTSQLVNLITAQRVYQANAQTIKTEDTIMQTLVSLQ